MAGMSEFGQAHAQLTGLPQQQAELQRAVASGELWMDADVAERAACRCEQAIGEIDQWLNDAERRLKRLPFGDNHDGNAVADRFDQAAREFRKVMYEAQGVLRSMAATYRAAGRTVAEADAMSAQPFQGQLE